MLWDVCLEPFADLIRMQGELEKLEVEIHKLAGEPSNVNSPKQLGEILFERMGLPGTDFAGLTGPLGTTPRETLHGHSVVAA